MQVKQIFSEATSGNSQQFQLPDNSIVFRLSIIGNSLNPINAFVVTSTVANNLYLKIGGLTDSLVTVKLQCKTSNPNDDFNDTGQSWNEDFAGYHYLQSNV